MFYCPKCDGPTGVVETRAEIRSRKCRQCGLAFKTEEVELETKAPTRIRYFQRREQEARHHEQHRRHNP